MNISTTSLTTGRKWRSATGYDENRFRKLLSSFEIAYYEKFGKTLLERKADGPKESVIKSAEELLLFTLFSLKSGLTYDLLGFVTGMDASNAKRNQDLGINILKSMLYARGFAPARSFNNVAEFEQHFREYDTLIIDGEEQPIQRPSEEDSQKDNYSGKKKAYVKINGDNGIKWFK